MKHQTLLLLTATITTFTLPFPAGAQSAFTPADPLVDYNQSHTLIDQQTVLDRAEAKGKLVEGIEKYNALLLAYANILVADKARQKSLANLRLAEEHFSTGEANNFEVLKARNELLDNEQLLLKATEAWVLASADLSLFFKQKPNQLYRPADLQPETWPPYTPPTLRAEVNLEVFEEILERAQKQRQYRRVPGYALENGLVKLHAHWRLTGALLEKCTERQRQAQTYLRQVEVSHESGFSSQKDVQEAALLYARAMAAYVDTMSAHELARARLLEATGTLEEAVDDWLDDEEDKAKALEKQQQN